MAQVVIIGAGPGGLGAGWRFKEKGFDDFIVLERNSYPGGLSASFQTPEGFIYDIGGHVFFSRDQYFNRVAETLLKPANQIHYRTRNAFVYIGDRVVPYPFQDNITSLPPKTRFDIIKDLMAADREKWEKKLKSRGKPKIDSRDFLSWMRSHFRKTISNIFMEPYNRKVWAYDPRKMGSYWIKDRVSTLEVEKILEREIFKEETRGWGPNARFFFPHFGSGHLFSKISERFHSKISYNSEVAHIDASRKEIILTDGRMIPYTRLISSIPLNELIRFIIPSAITTKEKSCLEAAKRLRYNSGIIIGLGLNFDIQSDKHWIYFPDPQYPWFRMTVLSNYSPAVAPPGKSSLMFDISFNPYRGNYTSAGDIIPLLQTISFLPSIRAKDIISIFEKRVKYFYPIPTLERNRDLTILKQFLVKTRIHTVGRFGRWRYEEGNMDHAFLQGKSAADSILSGI